MVVWSGGDRGGGSEAGLGCVSRVLTASLSLGIGRCEGWWSRSAEACWRALRWWGERCDPFAPRWWRVRRRLGGPELGGASGGEDALAGDLAVVGECGEGLVELVGGGVVLQGLGVGCGSVPGERVAQRGVDLVGERVAAGALQRPGGRAQRVVPERERGGRCTGWICRSLSAARRGARGGSCALRACCDRAGDPGLRLGELLVGSAQAWRAQVIGAVARRGGRR